MTFLLNGHSSAILLVTRETFLLERHREHRAKMAEARLRYPGEWRHPEMAFTDEGGGFLRQEKVRQQLKETCEEAGVPYMRGFHRFRDAFSTVDQMDLEADPKVAQRVLRCKRRGMTLDVYTQPREADMRAAMERWRERVAPTAS